MVVEDVLNGDVVYTYSGIAAGQSVEHNLQVASLCVLRDVEREAVPTLCAAIDSNLVAKDGVALACADYCLDGVGVCKRRVLIYVEVESGVLHLRNVDYRRCYPYVLGTRVLALKHTVVLVLRIAAWSVRR